MLNSCGSIIGPPLVFFFSTHCSLLDKALKRESDPVTLLFLYYYCVWLLFRACLLAFKFRSFAFHCYFKFMIRSWSHCHLTCIPSHSCTIRAWFTHTLFPCPLAPYPSLPLQPAIHQDPPLSLFLSSLALCHFLRGHIYPPPPYFFVCSSKRKEDSSASMGYQASARRKPTNLVVCWNVTIFMYYWSACIKPVGSASLLLLLCIYVFRFF